MEQQEQKPKRRYPYTTISISKESRDKLIKAYNKYHEKITRPYYWNDVILWLLSQVDSEV